MYFNYINIYDNMAIGNMAIYLYYKNI